MQRSIFILSGGLDSTVASFIVRETTRPVLALTFDYGQKASQREMEASQKISKYLNVPHQVIATPWLREITRTALVNRETPLPQPSSADLDALGPSTQTAKSVWVPNRNGLFIHIAACFADAFEADTLVTGFNREEAATFPDNSADFVRAANECLSYSTAIKARIQSPTIGWTKLQIAQKALELNVPFQDLWFCYEGGALPCRCCESCQRDFRALKLAGVPDPWAPGGSV